MLLKAKIATISEPKSGYSFAGKPWAMRFVQLKWEEEREAGQVLNGTVCASLYDEDFPDFAAQFAEGDECEFDLYFSLHISARGFSTNKVRIINIKKL